MINSISIDQSVSMKMRDGVVLVADIYRPGDNGKYPAIIMRTPYHSDGIFGHGYTKLMPTIRAGYVLVIAYIRGRYGSGGKYDLAAPQTLLTIISEVTFTHIVTLQRTSAYLHGHRRKKILF